MTVDHGAIRTHKSLVPKTNALTIRPRGQFGIKPLIGEYNMNLIPDIIYSLKTIVPELNRFYYVSRSENLAPPKKAPQC